MKLGVMSYFTNKTKVASGEGLYIYIGHKNIRLKKNNLANKTQPTGIII